MRHDGAAGDVIGVDREARRETETAGANPVTPPPLSPPVGARHGANERNTTRHDGKKSNAKARHITKVYKTREYATRRDAIPRVAATRPTGFEPATSGSTVRCSNQLSYGPWVLPQSANRPAKANCFQLAKLGTCIMRTARTGIDSSLWSRRQASRCSRERWVAACGVSSSGGFTTHSYVQTLTRTRG